MAIIDRRGVTVGVTPPPLASTSPSAELAIKTPVRAATTSADGNIARAGLLTIDGVTLSEGDRVLVKNQVNPIENGIFNVSTGPWTRSIDLDAEHQAVTGTVVVIREGAVQARSEWMLIAGGEPVIPDTTALSFVRVTLGNLVAANNLSDVANPATALRNLGGVSNALTNARLQKSDPYTVANNVKGATVALGGNNFYELTLGDASDYDADFWVMVLNEDAARGKRVSCGGIGSFILWPGQSCVIFNQNNIWRVNPVFQRWKAPLGTVLYVDAINGDDANDGLAPGVGGAVKTLGQALRVNVKDYFDLSSASNFPNALVIVQLADNATAGVAGANAYSLAHIAFTPVGGEGRSCILIRGNASDPSKTVISDSGGANIGAYGAVNIQAWNLQLGQTGAATPVANSGIQAADGANVRCMGGVIFGTCTAMQMLSENGGNIVFQGSFGIVGGAAWSMYAQTGKIDTGGQACTILNTPAYSQQFAAAFEKGLIVTAGTVWTGSATGARNFARNQSLIFTNGTDLPGSSPGSNDSTSYVG